jgi:iron only hydrogenase large subunit-like protein
MQQKIISSSLTIHPSWCAGGCCGGGGDLNKERMSGGGNQPNYATQLWMEEVLIAIETP